MYWTIMLRINGKDFHSAEHFSSMQDAEDFAYHNRLPLVGSELEATVHVVFHHGRGHINMHQLVQTGRF